MSTCFNCSYFNHHRDRDKPTPCQFRKNHCSNSKNCKHFKFLGNIGDKITTTCHECGAQMTAKLRWLGDYSDWCDSCKEKYHAYCADLAWREYKHCRYCDFFYRIQSTHIEPQGICIIKGDPEEDDPFHPYISTSFSRRCECFSFNYDNFKLALHEKMRLKNWDKWIFTNLEKLAKRKFNTMLEYYNAVQTMIPHPETGEAIPVGDSDYWQS